MVENKIVLRRCAQREPSKAPAAIKNSAINGTETSKNKKPISTRKRRSNPRIFTGLAPFLMGAFCAVGGSGDVLLDNAFFGGADLIVE